MLFEEMIIMQINNAYSANINVTARVVPASVNNNTTTAQESTAQTTTTQTTTAQATPQNNTVANPIPVDQLINVDDVNSTRYAITELLQQFSEWMRVSSESRRMEFLYNVLLKESHEKSELFGLIMDIARRIMRGEKVSLDEMRLLSEQNPQLLFAVIVMRDEKTDIDERDRRRERERRRKDRRSGPRRRDHNLRNHNLSNTRAIESMRYTVPSSPDKQVHTLLAQKTVRKSYGTAGKSKNLSISINTVITNPLEAAQ